MSGISGITATCRNALATAISNAGVSCQQYDGWDISSTATARLGAAEWELDADTLDQRITLKSITFPVYIYQLVDGSADSSLAYQDTNLELVVNGIGADRTLGGLVADAQVTGSASGEFYRDTGSVYSVVSVPVKVTPFGNAAG